MEYIESFFALLELDVSVYISRNASISGKEEAFHPFELLSCLYPAVSVRAVLGVRSRNLQVFFIIIVCLFFFNFSLKTYLKKS